MLIKALKIHLFFVFSSFYLKESSYLAPAFICGSAECWWQHGISIKHLIRHNKAFLYSFKCLVFMILRNSMMIMVRLSTAQQDCCVIWDFNPQSEKCITWDWEKTAFRQYVSVNSQEPYTLVSAVCQCIINVCLGCLCFFLSTHRWQEALTVYPRTNKQNQKKKRKVDPPTQQVTIGSPILNDDFEYPDRNWRIKITWLRSSMFLFVSNDAGFLNRKVSQLAFCCLFGFFF